jgi:hypothetical protein
MRVFLLRMVSGEEFEEAARGLVASVGDHARHHDAATAGDAGQRPGFGWHKSLWFAIGFHGT